MAVAIRADAGRMPGLACVQYRWCGAACPGSATSQQIRRRGDRRRRPGFHRIAGRPLPSDLLIVPFLPRSVDVWASADIAGLVEEANGVRDGLRAYAVLNAADPGSSSDNTEAAAAFADFPQLTLLDAPIRRRKAFANAVGLGLSVEELSPRDHKACEELAALVSIVFSDAVNIKITERALK
jgi:chromosome partitioning protein